MNAREIINKLEAAAANTDTDHRWLAATLLREYSGIDRPFQPERKHVYRSGKDRRIPSNLDIDNREERPPRTEDKP